MENARFGDNLKMRGDKEIPTLLSIDDTTELCHKTPLPHKCPWLASSSSSAEALDNEELEGNDEIMASNDEPDPTKLEEIAKVMSFTRRKKNCRVNLEDFRKEMKGLLTITAKIFELTPKLLVVECQEERMR
ncbi:hypothetical protein WN944_026974 [Citrus x changshan-huyou]|uniref:Uncharacterized protein n=1 Tax=Citrus x changshan-huyou TaxID=2935761 RepID=A0AAP0LJW5_9ROSI